MPKIQLKPLGRNEERTLEMYNSPIVGEHERSIIENVVTGARRLELCVDLVEGKPHEPTLYFSADRCAVGRPLFDFYEVGAGMRILGQQFILANKSSELFG